MLIGSIKLNELNACINYLIKLTNVGDMFSGFMKSFFVAYLNSEALVVTLKSATRDVNTRQDVASCVCPVPIGC